MYYACKTLNEPL